MPQYAQTFNLFVYFNVSIKKICESNFTLLNTKKQILLPYTLNDTSTLVQRGHIIIWKNNITDHFGDFLFTHRLECHQMEYFINRIVCAHNSYVLYDTILKVQILPRPACHLTIVNYTDPVLLVH